MTIQRKQLRRMLEARVNEARSPRRGRERFVHELRETLGIARDPLGRPCIKPASASPYEYSFRQLAEAIGGRRLVEEVFNPIGGVDQVSLREAALDPSTMLDISTFSLAASGLVEAAVLERFQHPSFIGDQLVTIRPTRHNGEKMIGVAGIGDQAQTRKPGEPHARAQFGETWIETPELEEKALAVEVTQEAVFHDQTGQILDVAGGVGEDLGYLRERTIIDLVIGVTNPYRYKGTDYPTYAAYEDEYPWVNSHENEFADENNIDEAAQLFSEMTDPETGKEILVLPRTILCAPSREKDFLRALHATEVRNTIGSAVMTVSPPNVKAQQYTLLSSPIAFNRARNAGGLNLGTADAKKRWWIGDFQKAFLWMEAFPVRVRAANASEYTMLDRGLIAAYFAQYRGVGAVKEPRYVVQNRTSRFVIVIDCGAPHRRWSGRAVGHVSHRLSVIQDLFMNADVEKLKVRRNAILDELAAMTTGAIGATPNASLDGESVDHVGYRRSLYDELSRIDERLASAEGPWELRIHQR